MSLNAIQANVYANLLFTHCERWQDLLVFHLNQVFHKQSTSTSSSRTIEPKEQSGTHPKLPKIKSIKDLALVLLNCNDKHEMGFELIRHHLSKAQLRELFLAMLFVASNPETATELKINSTLRDKSMATIMLGHLLRHAKSKLSEQIKVPCQTVVNTILSDQDAQKTDEFTMSEHCMKTTATGLNEINHTILHFLHHNKRVFLIMSLLSGALQRDSTLNEAKKIEVLLGILSIRIISDVIHTIDYQSEHANALAGKYLVKLFAHLLTTGADEKPSALNELPQCHKRFLRDPANRTPYVAFCNSLDPLLIQTYTYTGKAHTSKDKPVLDIEGPVTFDRDELYLWTAFGEIYTNFQTLKSKTLAQHIAQMASVYRVMKRQISGVKIKTSIHADGPVLEEGLISNIPKMDRQLVEKVKNHHESTTDFLFPALSPPYVWGDVDELRLQLSQFTDIYEHFLTPDTSLLVAEWLEKLKVIKILLQKYARPENRPRREMVVSSAPPSPRSVTHSPSVQNLNDKSSKRASLPNFSKFFSGKKRIKTHSIIDDLSVSGQNKKRDHTINSGEQELDRLTIKATYLGKRN